MSEFAAAKQEHVEAPVGALKLLADPHGWIAAEDAQPESMQDVLCYYHGNYWVGWYCAEGDYWDTLDGGNRLASAVLYWQPLPLPPETV